MKPLLYRLAELAAWHSGLGQKTARDTIAILMLHGVHDQGMATRCPPPYNSLSLDSFTAGVQALLRRHTLISLDQAVAMLAGRCPWRPRCVVLTFDDSLQCLLPTAATWLARLGLNATFYVSTEVIETQQPYWWKRLEWAVDHATAPQATVSLPQGGAFTVVTAQGAGALTGLKGAIKKLSGPEVEAVVTSFEQQLGPPPRTSDEQDPYARPMSWEDVKQLLALGMTVGSHTVSHPNLSLLSAPELEYELTESRRQLEARLGVPCRHLAYPYGAHSDRVCEAARGAGYGSSVTTECPGFNPLSSDPFRLRRSAMPFAPHKVGWALSGISS